MSLGAIIVLAAIIGCSALMLWIVLVVLPKRQQDQQTSLLKVFGAAVELRFPGHEGMTDRVANLCVEVGRELGLCEQGLRQLEQAARLRDIGLCAIPWKLVNERPQSDWTQAERATYDRHSEVSGAMLEMVPSLSDLAAIVRHHHAPFNAADVPLAARIIAVVDTYVVCDRQQGSLVARTLLDQQKGEALDPHVVEACFRVLPSDRVASA
ncbi:MAG: hypothetical protein JNK63_04435 [Chthonomonas sp.]|nr:hypothetical protein [Chthonomonas sp.]